MRYCEFKQRYDPQLGQYVMKHIYDETTYGEGLGDVFKSVGRKILGKTGKKLAKNAAIEASKATGKYVGNKGGDKIVELLNKNRTTVPPVMIEPTMSALEPKKLTNDDINERVNMILSGGKLRKRKFI